MSLAEKSHKNNTAGHLSSSKRRSKHDRDEGKCSKVNFKAKQKKKHKKMSDNSSETSSTASAQCGPKASSGKKSQCDLCKLSYSSEKELTEHLVSLMHHTKLENREKNSAHYCNVCKDTCANMAEYRKHIAEKSHTDNVLRLKGEYVPPVSQVKNKKSRWGRKPKAKTWQMPHNQNQDLSKQMQWNSHFNSTFPNHPSDNFRPWQQQWSFSLNRYPQQNNGSYHDPGYTSGYSKTRYNDRHTGHQNQRWSERHDRYYSNDLPLNTLSEEWMSDDHRPVPQLYNPEDQQSWGSGAWNHMDRNEQYDPYRNGLNEIGHWDEQSLLRQEEFLASVEESFGRAGNQHWQYDRPFHDRGDITSQINNASNAWHQSKTNSSNFTPSHGLSFDAQSNSFDAQSNEKNSDTQSTGMSIAGDRKRPVPEGGHEDRYATPKRSSLSNSDSQSVKEIPSFAFPDMSRKINDKTINSIDEPLSRPVKAVKELDKASDDLLLRAEKLCKELREKRLASSKQQENTKASQGMAANHQRRQEKKMTIVRDDPSSGDKSGDSGISLSATSRSQQSKRQDNKTLDAEPKKTFLPAAKTQRSLSEIRKSLEVSVPSLKEDSKKCSLTKSGKESSICRDQTLSSSEKGSGVTRVRRDSAPSGLMVSPKEQRDSGGGNRSLKTGHFSKDNLKKMINAPNSRDQRLQLARLLQSREEIHNKREITSMSSKQLQLEGLHDKSITSVVVSEASTSRGPRKEEGLTTIKLEDLGRDIREQILSLIGPDCPGLEHIELSRSSTQAVYVSSEDEDLPRKITNTSKVKKKTNLGADAVKKKKKMKKISESCLVQGKANSGKVTLVSDGSESEARNNTERPKSSSHIGSITVYGDNDMRGRQVIPGKAKQKVYKEKQIDTQLKRTSLLKKKMQKKVQGKGSGEKDISSGKEDDGIFSQETHSSSVTDATADSRVSNKSITSVSSASSSSKHVLLKSTNKDHQRTNDLVPSHDAERQTSQSISSESIRKKYPLLMGSGSKSSVTPSSKRFLPESSSSVSSSPLSGSQASASASSSSNILTSLLTHTYAKALPATSISSAVPVSSSTSSQTFAQQTSPCSDSVTSENVRSMSQDSASLSQPSLISTSMHTTITSEPSQSFSSRYPATVSTSNSVSVANASVLPHPSPMSEDVQRDQVVVLDDIGEDPALENKSGDEAPLSLASSVTFSGDGSNTAVQELLDLSEREEHIKQESMSLELRLTRLHRLLEQAVVQINRCTERRTQLQQEEKEISSRRLSLLRDAAKGSGPSSTSKSSASTSVQSMSVDTNINISHTGVTLASGKYSSAGLSSCTSTSSVTAPATTTPPPNTSLSKADWLAKFASYLPSDPVLEQERLAAIAQTTLIQQSSEVCVNKDLNIVAQTTVPNSRDRTLSIRSGFLSGGEPKLSAEHSKAHDKIADAISVPLSTNSTEEGTGKSPSILNNPSTVPYMYLGTFHTPTTPQIIGTTPSLLSQSARKLPERESVLEQQDVSLPQLQPNQPIYIGGDDSDLGSIASSRASGASLGEQIMQYCRSTPGACLDAHPQHQSGDLTVIYSSDGGVSDSHCTMKNQSVEDRGSPITEEAGDRGQVIDHRVMPCSVVINRLALKNDTGIYGSLDHEAIRSAEVLHLAERSQGQDVEQGSAGGIEDEPRMLCPIGRPRKSASVSEESEFGGGKRKKLLTRQEREASRLSRHRQRRLVISSTSSYSDSEVEEDRTGKRESNEEREQVLVEAARLRESRLSNCSTENFSSDDKAVQAHDDSVMKIEPGSPKQETQSDVVVAECDSSTGIGIVDSESIRQRTKTLREMRESFEKTFGRPPRIRERETSQGINSTTSDQINISTESQTDQVEIVSLDRDSPDPFYEARFNEQLVSEDERKMTGLRRFEGSYGPVCEIQEFSGHLYVGYQNIGISVFDLNSPSEEKISEHEFGHLECFYVTEINETVTVIVGNGSSLVSCRANSSDIPPRDMGTFIRCIAYSEPDIYLGLDTGEVAVLYDKTLQQRSSFICGNKRIISMALGQEGAIRVLCVSDGDGTISVFNARQGLLLRILGGRRLACSLQVDKSLLFSGSVDGSVHVHNFHTADVEHVFRDNRGSAVAVHLYKDYLFTGGMDKLVRCYDIKTRQLIQVYYGAGKGPISKIAVTNNKLITGNLNGITDAIDLNLGAQNKCPHMRCGLNFAHHSHLQWHFQQVHADQCC